jgi:phosphatidylglycerophosphate synthase
MAFWHPDMTRHARRKLFALGLVGPHRQFFGVAGAGLLALLVLGPLLVSGVTPVSLLATTVFYAVGVALAGLGLSRTFPHSSLGMCNVVTLFRLSLVSILVLSLLSASNDAVTIFAVAVVALALDGVDGWFARREGRVSDFGARFDMEVDAALALVLACLAFQNETAGPLVLLLALPRYLFAAATLVFPWLDGPLPERFSRKVVCVLQLGTLIVVQVPFVPPMISGGLVAISALTLIWSFERDVVWLWRARAAARV